MILIALIVLIFSGGPKVDELQEEVRGLRADIERLEEKIDTLLPPGAADPVGQTPVADGVNPPAGAP